MTTIREAMEMQSPSGGQKSAPGSLAEPTGAAQVAPASPVEAPASDGFYNFVETMESASRGLSTEGPVDGRDASNATALDSISIGSIDNILSVYEGGKALLDTGSWDAATKAYEDKKLDVNLALHRNREDYPGMSLIGDVGGSFVSGYGLGKGGTSILQKISPKAFRFINQNPWRNIVVSSAGGAGHAGMYRYNSDGTAEEIVNDAGIALLGGMAFGSLFRASPVRWVASKVTSNVPRAQQQMGEELYRMLSARDTVTKSATAGKVVGSNMSPQDMVKQFGDKDLDLIIGDFYPGLNNRIKEVLTDTVENPSRTSSRLRDVLAARNNGAIVWPDQARQAIKDAGNGVFETPTAFNSSIRKVHESLRPQYDALFDGIDARGIKIKRNNLVQAIERIAQGDPRIDTSASYFRDAMKMLRTELRKNSTRTKGRVGHNQYVNARAVHNVKRLFGEKLGEYNNQIMRGNALIYDSLNEFLSGLDPKYADLASTYSTASSAKSAYAQGQRLFTTKNLSPEDVAEVAARFNTGADGNAFIKGAKFALWNKVKDTASAETVRKRIAENRNRIDMLSDIIGPDETQELVDNITNSAIKEQSAKLHETVIRGGGASSPTKDAISMIRDAFVALNPGASVAARSSATHRLVNPTVQSAAERSGVLDVIDQALGSPAAELPKVLSNLDDLARGGQLPAQIPGQMARRGTINPLADAALGAEFDIFEHPLLQSLMGAAPQGRQPEAPPAPSPKIKDVFGR